MHHSRAIRLERHEHVGRLIQHNARELINRWSRRAVEEQPDARRVHHEDLLDHLPSFLNALGSSLCESDEDKAAGHEAPAAKHGEQRWENGWSLPEVVRDYQLLRTVVFEYLDEALQRGLSNREVLAVNLAFDDAIAASVASFVAEREEEVRHVERLRVEQERRPEEDRLRRRADLLADLDRRKDQFLAVLGHELRGPLAPLRNAVQLLGLGGNDPILLANVRDILDRQTTQMTRLVDELLDVSRIAQGKAQLHLERLDLGALVRAVAGDHRAELEAGGLALDVDVPQQPLWVRGDPARLGQVLGNLLHNAGKFTDPGGRVKVRTTEEGGWAVLAIEDNGVGISAEALPRLFEAFSQADATLTRSKGGLGLGLSVVKGLVDLHGGQVRAANPGPGRGTTFTVLLPRETAPAGVPVAAVASPAVPQGRRKVLIIEDSRDSAESLRMLLTVQGLDVDVAYTGADGIGLAQQVQPDVIVCDLGLPGMSGYEVARALRATPATSTALLVSLSGYGQEEDRDRARDAGFDEVLVKPVAPELLFRVLNQRRS